MRMICRLYVILVAFQNVILSNENAKYECATSGNVVRRLFNIGLEKCKEECVNRPGCLSLNYRRMLKLCELFATVNLTVPEKNREKDCVLFTRSSLTIPEHVRKCNCSVGSYCHPNNQTCSVKECGSLYLANSKILGNMYYVGAVLKSECKDNFTRQSAGPKTLKVECLADGKWTPTPICYQYLGCFPDDAAHSLLNHQVNKKWMKNNKTMAMDVCFEFCSGYVYASLQAGENCFCGNTLNGQPLPDRNNYCTIPCFGNKSQICGDYYKGSTYQIG